MLFLFQKYLRGIFFANDKQSVIFKKVAVGSSIAGDTCFDGKMVFFVFDFFKICLFTKLALMFRWYFWCHSCCSPPVDFSNGGNFLFPRSILSN